VAGMAEHLAQVEEVNVTAADTVTVAAIAGTMAAKQRNRRNRQPLHHPRKDLLLQQNLRAVGAGAKAMAGAGPSATKTNIIKF
jgi:hypothetical protein